MMLLRDRLKNLNPELYQSFIRCWDIAWNEWLPALVVNLDSYNSYPHLRNLETYLEQSIYKKDENLNSELLVNLSAIEIYLLLCAILFHDLGRVKGNKNHGRSSRELLNEHWAAFGIQSHELAQCLGRICHYHECLPEDRNELKQSLCNIVVDPYGEIRERSLASMLVLIDHLDSAFTRVLPVYLKNSSDLKVVGAFRRVIRGVYVDHFSQMIKTVISDQLPSPPKRRINDFDIENQFSFLAFKFNEDLNNTIKIDEKNKKNWENFCHELKKDYLEGKLQNKKNQIKDYIINLLSKRKIVNIMDNIDVNEIVIMQEKIFELKKLVLKGQFPVKLDNHEFKDINSINGKIKTYYDKIQKNFKSVFEIKILYKRTINQLIGYTNNFDNNHDKKINVFKDLVDTAKKIIEKLKVSEYNKSKRTIALR